MPLEALSSIRSSLARWKHLDLSMTPVLPLGITALDAALPGGGVVLGGVTELQVRGASGAATSFALAACRAAQQLGALQRKAQPCSKKERGVHSHENGVWCAFIDPSASLFAPGATRLGVDLSHLLVTRPGSDAIERVAVRIAEANLVAVLVIDLRGIAQQGVSQRKDLHCISPRSVSPRKALQQGAQDERVLDEHSWQRTVRRLSLAIKSSSTSVLLITQAEQFQSLPLPTFQRLELTRSAQASFELRVAKDRTGRISAPGVFPCSIFDQSHFDQSSLDLNSAHRRPEAVAHGLERSSAALERKVS